MRVVHLAQNAGLMSIAVVGFEVSISSRALTIRKALFGNMCNYAFGRNFDRHSKPAASTIEGMVCLEGPGCYAQRCALTSFGLEATNECVVCTLLWRVAVSRWF